MKHTHNLFRFSTSTAEHRLAHRGPEAKPSAQENTELPKNYKKGEGLKEYAKVTQEKFKQNVADLAKKLEDTKHAKYAEQVKKYVEGDFAKWTDRFAEGEFSNAKELENGIRKVEDIIQKLEGYVAAEAGEAGKAELRTKGTLKERNIAKFNNEAMKNGIESGTLSNGMHVMDVPDNWTFLFQDPTALKKINSDPSRPYTVDISGERKRFMFSGKVGDKVEVTTPTGEKMSIALTKGEAPGSLKIDIPGFKRAEYAKKAADLKKVTKDAIDAFQKPARTDKEKKEGVKARQQNPEDATAAVKGLEAELALLKQYESYLDSADVSRDRKQMEQGITYYKQQLDQKRVQMVTVDLREGKEEEAKKTIDQIQRSYKDTYGTGEQAYKLFREVNKTQLERTDMPYKLSAEVKDNNLKLTYEKNPEYKKGRAELATEKNKQRALKTLADALRIDVSKTKGKLTADQVIKALEADDAGEKYGMYMIKGGSGNLIENDKGWFTTDEVFLQNFKGELQKDPVAALNKLGGFNWDSLEDQQTKEAVSRTLTGSREFDKNRDRTPEEIDLALSKIKHEMSELRGSIKDGTATIESVQTAVRTINLALANDIKGIDRVERAVNALGSLSPIETKNGKGVYQFAYKAEGRKLRVTYVAASKPKGASPSAPL
jgi:hypothetical protein